MTSTSATSSCEIVVLGAGPAGLVAAWKAAASGHDVVVVERAERVGGMAASFDVAGVRVDHGSHRLHPSTDPEILTDLRHLLGDDLQTRERHGRIQLLGRWVKFPLQTGDMLANLPRAFALRAARDALVAPLRRPRADTFEEVVRARLGPTVADTFYAPYVEKLWATPPDRLSGELARRRVGASSPLDVARRLVRGRSPEGRRFLYPRRGFGQIAEALADAAEHAGARMLLGARVTGVALDADGVTVTLADGSRVDGRRLWSTVPVPGLAAMASPDPGSTVLEAARRLRHRALALVYLVVERDRYTEFDAHYFPALDNPVARLSEPKNYRDSSEDPTGLTVLCAEVPCWEGDERWSADSADLGALVVDALVDAGLPDPDPSQVEVRRLPRVYPLYAPGFENSLADLERWVAEHPPLLTFGRQGLFVPDNTHHALAMGQAAAGALGSDGSFDHAAWAEARDTFRTHVVED